MREKTNKKKAKKRGKKAIQLPHVLHPSVRQATTTTILRSPRPRQARLRALLGSKTATDVTEAIGVVVELRLRGARGRRRETTVVLGGIRPHVSRDDEKV